jgi:hypothetical protein
MHEYIIFLILISAGVLLSIVCVFAGAFIMYRGKAQPGIDGGFLKDPKGDMFTVPFDDDLDFPKEPNKDEENVLNRTNKFLKTITGGNNV